MLNSFLHFNVFFEPAHLFAIRGRRKSGNYAGETVAYATIFCGNMSLIFLLRQAFIQLGFNLGSGQVEVLLVVCSRFVIVKNSDNGLD